MDDHSFNIQELLLHQQVKLIISTFMRITTSSSQFTESEDTKAKTVANSRIHVERAIGRLNEFAIQQGPIPLTMIDLVECSMFCYSQHSASPCSSDILKYKLVWDKICVFIGSIS